MKQKELQTLKEYRKLFYEVKFQLSDIYMDNVRKVTNKEQMLRDIANVWRNMNKICEKLG